MTDEGAPVIFSSETNGIDYSVSATNMNQYSLYSQRAAYVYFPIETKTIGKFDLGKEVKIEFSIEKELVVDKDGPSEVDIYCAECEELNIINCGNTIAEAFKGLEDELEINIELYLPQRADDSLEVRELSERLRQIKTG